MDVPLNGELQQRTTRWKMRGERGAALVEFAVTAPVLLLVVLGGMRFALAINNYVILTEATRAGGRQLALSRGSTATNIYNNSVNRVTDAAPNLRPINCTGTGLCVTLTTSTNAAPTVFSSCTAGACTLEAGAAARVTATYPCSLRVMGITFVAGCVITSQMTERVE